MSNLTFNKLREQLARKREHERATVSGEASQVAKFLGYGVAAAAIFVMATLYATVISVAFKDSTTRVIGIAAAYIVGSSAVVFLVAKNQLLMGKWQFRIACVFVALELVLLAMGASYALGQALGWNFDPTYVELTHAAIIITLPVVAAEWLTVLALDPKAMLERDINFRVAEQHKSDADYRNTVKSSDVARGIRDAAILREVVNEELARLPNEDRATFLAALKAQGYEVGDVPIASKKLPTVIDNKALPMATLADDSPVELPTKAKNGKHPKG